MPPAAKRRKTAVAAKCDVTTPIAQQGIQAFGRISKSQVQVLGKSILNKVDNTIERRSVPPCDNGKKRKSEYDEGVSEAADNQSRDTTEEYAAKPHQNGLVIAGAGLAPTLQSTTNLRDSITPTKGSNLVRYDTQTPTKGSRSLLEAIELTSSPSTTTPSPIVKHHDTPPSSPISVDESLSNSNVEHKLPDELQDLIDLHSSFLSTLSLHYAHNGPTIPADLRSLTSGVERTWRKRRVLKDDIQRLVAVQKGACPDGKGRVGTLNLIDYGHGKICIELADFSQFQNAQRRPINEELLNATFIRNLEQRWSSYKAIHPSNPSPTTFISSLPVPQIPLCASLSELAPLLSKGQRRLEDLKAGAIKAQKSPLKNTTGNASSTSCQKAKPTKARTTDLFSRLKAKQLHQSTLPLPPSSDTLARKSALQRLPEIAPILESLAVSSRKHCNDDASAEAVRSRMTHVSFTMPTLVQHLQMSLRNPVGKEEAVGALKLLAEVTPEWVDVRNVGRLVSVTIRGSGVGRDRLEERIRECSDRM